MKGKSQVKVWVISVFLIVTLVLTFFAPLFQIEFMSKVKANPGTTYDFEGETVGEVPSGWDDSTSSSTCSARISDDVACNGNKSVKFLDSNAAGAARLIIASAFDETEMTAYMYVDATTKGLMLYTYETHPITDILCPLSFESDGKVYAYNGVTKTEIMSSYTAQQWYKVRIVHNLAANTYDVYIADNLEADDFSFYSGTATNFRSCRFSTFSAISSGLQGYIDDVTIGEVIEDSTPPTYQNVGSNATSIGEGGTILLYGQGKDETGLDWAWLWTNETGGTGKNYTTLIEYVTSNGIFEWFNKPASVYFSGTYSRTYITFIDDVGKVKIKYCDHVSKTLSSEVQLHDFGSCNDHCSPTLLILPDGKLLVFYSDHVGPLYCRRSTNTEDINTWDSEVTIESDDASYPQPRRMANGDIWVFYRYPDTYPREEVYRISSNNGSSWGDRTVIVDGDDEAENIYAFTYLDSGGRLHLAFSIYNNTDVKYKHIRYAFRDTDGTWKHANGSSITTPLSNSNSDNVYDSLPNDCWCWDVVADDNGNAKILFMDEVQNSAHIAKFANFSSNTWSVYNITTSGPGPFAPYSNYYSAGGVLDQDNVYKSYIAKKTNGITEIQEWTSANFGETWSNSLNITEESSYGQARPQLVKNHCSELKLVWCEPTSYSTYTNWDSRLKGYPDLSHYGSPLDMNDVADAWAWSNFTWCNTSIPTGTTVQWRIYYNDTYGNVNGTGIHSFTVGAGEYDFVDLDTSNVDSSDPADKGAHSDFESEKAVDGMDTLTEANTGGSDADILYVDGFNSINEEWDETGASPWLSDSDTNYISTLTDEEWHEEFTFANHIGSETITSVYLYIEINGPSGRKDYVVIDIHDGADWTNIADQNPAGDAYVWYNFDVGTQLDTWTKINASKLRVQYQRSGSPSTETIYVRRAYVNASYTSVNYQLDLEIQWTYANYTRTNEYLCIKTGTFSGSENIMVYSWNVSTLDWHWSMNLTASQWNNISVTDWLNNETFTVRFLGGTETSDSTLDTWQIDAALLHTWTLENVAPIINQLRLSTTGSTENITTIDVFVWYDWEANITDTDTLLDIYNLTIRIMNNPSQSIAEDTPDFNATKEYWFRYLNIADTWEWYSGSTWTSTSDWLDAGNCAYPTKTGTNGWYLFRVKLNKIAIKSASWHFSALVYDSADNNANKNFSSITVNGYAEIVVVTTTHTWTNIQPDTQDNLIDEGSITINVTCNYTFDLEAQSNSSYLIDAETNQIGIGNITIHKDTLGSSISLTISWADILGLTSLPPCNEVNTQYSFKLWLDVPVATEPGDYQYKCEVRVTET